MRNISGTPTRQIVLLLWDGSLEDQILYFGRERCSFRALLVAVLKSKSRNKSKYCCPANPYFSFGCIFCNEIHTNFCNFTFETVFLMRLHIILRTSLIGMNTYVLNCICFYVLILTYDKFCCNI